MDSVFHIPEMPVLRWLDTAYFCANLYIYIFVLLSFIWSDGDLSSYSYELHDISAKYLGIFYCFVAKGKMFRIDGRMN